jgi:hypothetical protein
MATLVTIDVETYKRRGPLAVWLLSFVTVGVYYFVWYYKINDEARRYLRDESIRPGISLLAVLLGWILIVPPYVSIYRTCQRVLRMQERASTTQRIIPVLGLIASFFLALHIPYIQSELNRTWEVELAGRRIPAPPVPPPEPPPPPVIPPD